MTTIAPTPPHDTHTDLEGLLERLARIGAQRAAMRVAIDGGSSTLDAMLDTLEHDLTLAARAAASLHDRMATAGES